MFDGGISKAKGMDNPRRVVGGALFKAAVIIVICYAAETGIMHLLARFNLGNSAIAPVLDSLTLILVMTPFIYLLFIKPMKREMEEKKALSASLEKLNRMLLTVSNCNQALVRATDGKQLMDDVCRVLTETGGYRMAWIGLAEHNAEKTVKPAAYSGHSEGYVEALNITWADTKRGQSPTGIAIRTGKPVVVRKIASDEHFLSGGGGVGAMEALKRGYASMVALPLTDGEAVIGSLNIYSDKADSFDENEMRLLMELAGDLSFGIRHHRIKEELEASEKKFKGLADNALVGIVQSTTGGEILYANNALLEMFEFGSLDEFISTGVLRRWKNPEDRKKMVEKLKSSGRASLEAEMLTGTGKTITVTYSAVISDDTISATIMDITERKRGEAELRSANEELKTAAANMEKTQAVLLRQEKLASIGTLSAGVAHEILNPLNIIGTIVQLMQMDEWPGETKDKLNEIMTQIRRATKITNNLRMFAHVHKREITAVDVKALFEKTVLLMEHDLNLDNITIDRDYGKDLPAAHADQDLLAQVYLNILNNSRQALQEIKDDRKRLITVKTRAFPGKVEVSLSNNGPHIPGEIIGKIFDPFFTTKDPDKGTGLGLSMAHTFIQDFGGTLGVQNNEGEGVTFIITLPAADKEGKEK